MVGPPWLAAPALTVIALGLAAELILTGRVQTGEGDAARWLLLFSDAYARKTGMHVFPGSLNLALAAPFDWFAPRLQRSVVWFGREEYGGERDILLLPCVLTNLERQRAFLWSTTTAARDPGRRLLVEVIAPVALRMTYGLEDSDVVDVEVPDAVAGRDAS